MKWKAKFQLVWWKKYFNFFPHPRSRTPQIYVRCFWVWEGVCGPQVKNRCCKVTDRSGNCVILLHLTLAITHVFEISAVQNISGFINRPYRVPTATADRTWKVVPSHTERFHTSLQVSGERGVKWLLRSKAVTLYAVTYLVLISLYWIFKWTFVYYEIVKIDVTFRSCFYPSLN